MDMQTKEYSRRDSATRLLREKYHIPSTHYDQFMDQRNDHWIVDLKSAEEWRAGFETATKAVADKPSAPIKRKQVSTRPEKAPQTELSAGRKKTFSARCRELILQGLSNKEVWNKIHKEYGLSADDKRKIYPAWYRHELKKRGELDE